MDKKRLLISVFLIFLCSYFYARGIIVLSFGQSCDVGEHQEIVFEEKRVLSLLQWPMYPAFASTFSLSLILKHFHISSEIAISYPAFTGDMLDSDYTDVSEQRKTLFSCHNARLQRGIVTSLSLGIPLQVYVFATEKAKKSVITLEPALLFYFSHLSWHAKGGYTQYKGSDGSKFWNETWQKEKYKGGGIEYTKNTFLTFLALNLHFSINNVWFIYLNSALSPFLLAKSSDIHFDRDSLYVDTFIAPAIAIKEDLSFEYKINRFSFSFAMTFLFSYTNFGSTSVLKHSTGEYLSHFNRGSAGLLSKVGRFSLSLRTWL